MSGGEVSHALQSPVTFDGSRYFMNCSELEEHIEEYFL